MNNNSLNENNNVSNSPATNPAPSPVSSSPNPNPEAVATNAAVTSASADTTISTAPAAENNPVPAPAEATPTPTTAVPEAPASPTAPEVPAQPVEPVSMVNPAPQNASLVQSQQVEAQPVSAPSADVNPALAPAAAQAPEVNATTTAPSSNDNMADEELLRSFIGKNYEKITTRPFNFAGFFFTTLYMFYRKMFLYAFLLFILNLIVLNVINNFFITFAFNIIVGLFVNKVYVSHAKKKINNIKLKNPQKDINELKLICLSKGGTSVGQVFLGLFVEIVIAFVVLFAMLLAGLGSFMGEFLNPNNWDVSVNDTDVDNNQNSEGKNEDKLLEDVMLRGYACFGTTCSISIETDGESLSYNYKGNDVELLKMLGDYNEYVIVNVYYVENGEERTITKYEANLKENNESLMNIKTEDELRKKIGLYTIGTHTATMTLNEIGMTGFGFNDEVSYTYIEYTFVDEKNNEYEMKYIIAEGMNSDDINLVENNNYEITFEVVEGTFDYEFYIKSFK